MTDPVTIRIQAEVQDALKEITTLRDRFLKFRTDYENAAKEVNAAVNNISGDKLVRQSEQLIAVIERFGGVGALTERQIRASNKVIDEAVEKYAAMGRTAPETLIKLQSELGKYVEKLEQVRRETAENIKEQAKLDEAFERLSNESNTKNVERLATAIQAVGGVSSLSSSEVKKLSTVFGEYFEKVERLGVESDEVSADVKKVALELTNEARALEQAKRETDLYSKELAKLVSQYAEGGGLQQKVEAYNNALGRQIDVSRLTAQEQEKLAKSIIDVTDRADRFGVEVGDNLRSYDDWAKKTLQVAEQNRKLEEQLKQTRAEQDKMKAAFSGQDTLRQANTAIKALQEIGGVTKLTRREQDQLNAQLQEAIAKYRALGQQAPREMLEVEQATRRVQATTKSLMNDIVQGFTIGQMSMGYFIGSTLERLAFGALRMVKNAIQGVIEGLVALGQRGSEVAKISDGFEKLAVSVGELPQALLDAGRRGLRGLATDFDIMEAANRAVLLGLNMTSKDFQTLSSSAIILGRAMNLGPAKALSDLVLALGRTSPRILDNLGIIVKIKDANEKYAKSIGVTTRELTAEQRTLAFSIESLRKMEAKLKDLGEPQLTFEDRIKRINVQILNFRDTISTAIAVSPALNVLFQDIADALALAFGKDKFEQIRSVATAIDYVAAMTVAATMAIIDSARKQLTTFTTYLAALMDLISQGFEFIKKQAHLSETVAFGMQQLPGAMGGLFKQLWPLMRGFSDTMEKISLGARTFQGEIVAGGAKLVKPLNDMHDGLQVTLVKMIGASKAGVSYNDIVAELKRRLEEAEGALDKFNQTTDKSQDPLKRFRASVTNLANELKQVDLGDPKLFAFVIEEYGKRVVELLEKAKALGVEVPQIIHTIAAAVKQADFEKAIVKQAETNRKSIEASNVAIRKSNTSREKQHQDDLSRTFEFWMRQIRDIEALNEQLSPKNIEEQMADISKEAELERAVFENKLAELRSRALVIGEAVSHVTVNYMEQMYTEALNLSKERERKAILVAKMLWAEHIADIKSQTLNLSNIISATLEDLPKQIQSAFTGGGGAMGALKSAVSGLGAKLGEMVFTGPLGQKLTEGAMNLFGQDFAAKFGAMMGPIGSAIGSLAGPLLAKISEMFQKPGFKDVMKRVGKDWGVTITEELAKKIDETAKKLFGGDRQAAEIFHMNDIIEAAGGINKLNFDRFLGQLRNVFVMVETGKFTVEQARKALDDNFSAFAEHIVESGRIASTAFLEILALNQRFKTESSEIREFLTAQTERAGKGLADMLANVAEDYGELGQNIRDLKDEANDIRTSPEFDSQVKALAKEVEEAQENVRRLAEDGKQGTDEYAEAVGRLKLLIAYQTVGTKELYEIQKELGILQGKQAAGAKEYGDDLERVGRLTLATFNAAIANGASATDAIGQVGPALDQLIGLYDSLGLSTENAALQELLRFRQLMTEHATLITAADGLNQTMLAMSNIGALNAETLADLEAQGLSTFNSLTAAGFTETQALQVMRGWLQNVYDAHNQLGIPIDENTQKLIDQGIEAGILQGKQETMVDVLKQGLGAIITLLGGELPDAWRRMADSARTASRDAAGYAGNVTSAVDTVATTLEETDWAAWAAAAAEAAEDAKEAIDTVTYGASPGGLVDVDRHLVSVGKRFYDTSRAASESMNALYNETVAVKDVMEATSPDYNVGSLVQGDSAAASSREGQAGQVVNVAFDVKTFDVTGMLQGVENVILPKLIDAVQNNRGGSLTRLRQVLGVA